jgi:hypothetical protein
MVLRKENAYFDQGDHAILHGDSDRLVIRSDSDNPLSPAVITAHFHQ